MARPAKPWYWKERDGWYVTIKGKRKFLAKGKSARKEAYAAFVGMPDDPEETPTTSRTDGQEICRLFLAHARVNLKPLTYAGYKQHLEPFGNAVKGVDGNAVQPKHVTKYLDERSGWGKTTRFNAITAIKRAWKWALEEGHITINSLQVLRRPRPERREDIPDEREIRIFLKAAGPAFRIVLEFIHETGCRPGEAFIMERRHVYLAHREVRYKIGEDKTSGKTGKRRVIHLNDRAYEILAELCKQQPTGRLFRNSKGKPWNRNSVNCAVRRIRARSGLDSRIVVCALRHHWATDALAKGVPIPIVAEMMGNSPEIVAKVYSHLSDKKSLLINAANLVRPTCQTENQCPMYSHWRQG